MSAPWWDSDWKDRSGPEYHAFVSNLPYSTNEGSLKDAFSSYSPLNADVSVSLLDRWSSCTMVDYLVPCELFFFCLG
jgi:hypothetical protein